MSGHRTDGPGTGPSGAEPRTQLTQADGVNAADAPRRARLQSPRLVRSTGAVHRLRQLSRHPRSRTLALATLAVLAVGPAGTAQAARPALDWRSCASPAFDRWKQVDDASLTGFDCAAFVRPLDRARPGVCRGAEPAR